jgi:putative endonuclease
MIASATQDWRAKRLIERQARYRAGLWAEVFAAIALMLKGYRILARRRKTRSGEIDLIAVRGTKLAFVEVKARPSLEAAEASISNLQARRMRSASEQWLARSPRYQNHEQRFDALYVLPWRWPIHRPDGA